MFRGRLRKIAIASLTIYTLLIFYFLYVGFNRRSFLGEADMRYSLIPEGIPLHFPMGRDFQIWFFELGNFAAFIPFGLIIPLLFRCTFLRFITLFILSITLLEILQMLSKLGAFDIDDIIINTLGAAVGFGAQRLVTKDRDKFKGFCKITLTALMLSIGVFAAVGSVNFYLSKGSNIVVALNELPLKDGIALWNETLSSFTAGQTIIEPKINMYSRKNARTNEFTYFLNEKYAKISGYVAIPDDVITDTDIVSSEISFIADDIEIYSLSLTAKIGNNQHISFQTGLNGTDELTITFTSDDPNPLTKSLIWDVTLTEVNTGQKIINGAKKKLNSLFKP